MKFPLRSFMLMLSALFLHGCVSGNSTSKIPAVRDFQPERYLGRWYEIARLPHSFEDGMSEVYAEYTPGEENRINVVNSGVRDGERRTVHGIAKFKGATDRGELEVSFFRPFWGDYKIFYLADDYSIAMVTGSTDKYLWILSRKPHLPRQQLNSLIELAKLHGFPVDKLIFPQQAETVDDSAAKE